MRCFCRYLFALSVSVSVAYSKAVVLGVIIFVTFL